MKIKKTIILLALIFTASFVLSGCAKKKVKKPQQKQPVVQQQQQKEEPANEDAIDFSDPGDDEVGKDIQEIDDLINETSPNEYNEDDLSEEGFDAELQ